MVQEDFQELAVENCLFMDAALTKMVDEREEVVEAVLHLEERPYCELFQLENMLIPSQPKPSIDEPLKLELK